MRCTHATIAASPAAVILGHSNFAGQIAMLPELPKFCPAGSGKLFCLSELEKTREFWPYGLINSTIDNRKAFRAVISITNDLPFFRDF